jgi:hypothetical protein
VRVDPQMIGQAYGLIEIPFSKLAVAALEKGIDALVLDPGMPVARRLDRTALNELVAPDRRN